MLRKLTNRFGSAFLLNVSHYAVIAPNPAGGTRLYPRSLNERYDGPATEVRDDFATFAGLPGFAPMTIAHHEHGGPVLVNGASVTEVTDLGDKIRVNLLGSTSYLHAQDSIDGILAAFDTDRKAPGE